MKMHSTHPRLFFSNAEKKAIEAAIQSSEMKTSGEIHVHLESDAKKTILEDAQKIFEKIGMANTQEKNGVLILLAVKDKQFAVIGDSGIHAKVEADFWQHISKILSEHFKKNDLAGGLVAGISKI